MISLITVTTGPALMAGSIFNFTKNPGVKEPKMQAMDTARKIPSPTVSPNKGVESNSELAIRASGKPQAKPNIKPLPTVYMIIL